MHVNRQRASIAILVVFLAFNAATSKPSSSSSTSSTSSTSSSGALTSTSSGEPKMVTPEADLPSVYDQEIVKRLTKKLTVAAKCPSATGPHRHWCVVDGFGSGTRATIGGTMVGLTIGLSDDFPAEQSLAKNVELSGFGMDARSDGNYAWITSIKPRSPSDRGVPDGIVSATSFFQKTGSDVKLESPLFTYVNGLSSTAKYRLRHEANGWSIAGPAQTDLRKVGDVWVAIEVPPARPLRGIYVSLLTGKMTR